MPVLKNARFFWTVNGPFVSGPRAAATRRLASDTRLRAQSFLSPEKRKWGVQKRASHCKWQSRLFCPMNAGIQFASAEKILHSLPARLQIRQGETLFNRRLPAALQRRVFPGIRIIRVVRIIILLPAIIRTAQRKPLAVGKNFQKALLPIGVQKQICLHPLPDTLQNRHNLFFRNLRSIPHKPRLYVPDSDRRRIIRRDFRTFFQNLILHKNALPHPFFTIIYPSSWQNKPASETCTVFSGIFVRSMYSFSLEMLYNQRHRTCDD